MPSPKGIVITRSIESETAIFLPALHDAESVIAGAIVRLLASPKETAQAGLGGGAGRLRAAGPIELAPEQRQAALTIARGGMAILTGGPRTGKTTTVRAIIELFPPGTLQVKLAAPTGRAARRLSETAKLPAETIHRCWATTPPWAASGAMRPNPVEADLVIIDEASMPRCAPGRLAARCALAGARALCWWAMRTSSLRWGPGNVLGDLIASGPHPDGALATNIPPGRPEPHRNQRASDQPRIHAPAQAARGRQGTRFLLHRARGPRPGARRHQDSHSRAHPRASSIWTLTRTCRC